MKRICAIIVTLIMFQMSFFQVSQIQAESEQFLKAGFKVGSIIHGQPFLSGNGGSDFFRIPSLITLDNGWIMAAADARYSQNEDGGGLDTMLCLSKDNGKTWEYSFPLFFPDSDGFDGINATTIIDPVLIQGKEGTVYLMADVNPTGVTTYYNWPKTGTGFVNINGEQCLAVTDLYDNTVYNPAYDNSYKYYPFYVDNNKNSEGYYMICDRKNREKTIWAVDSFYNLFQFINGKYEAMLTKGQTNCKTQTIQQNLFYSSSDLHIYQTGYMWLATSRDYGQTWENRILNPQIKHDDESALLVSPGRGLLLNDGTIVLGFYNMGRGDIKYDGHAHASFIYSKDGINWKRTEDIEADTLESEMVQIDDNTIRMFCRTIENKKYVTYIDAKRNADGLWCWKDIVTQTDSPSLTTCNMTAIMYSHKIQGKKLIVFAAPTNAKKRSEGKIYSFLVDDTDEHNMINCFSKSINEEEFQYSSLTELKNGGFALLWEGRSKEELATKDDLNFEVFNLKSVLGTQLYLQGDLDDNGDFNISDIVILQKWLIAVPDIELKNWKAADFCEDDKLDIFDLCLMRRALINAKKEL